MGVSKSLTLFSNLHNGIKMEILVTGSIVLFQSEENILKSVIASFLNTDLSVKLYLIDNSPIDTLRNIINDERVIYVHNPSNPGFGAAHNVAIKRAITDNSSYHFVINPDVFINETCLINMIDFMQSHHDVGMLMPEILNENRSIQHLPKLLPTPLSVVKRILNRKFNLFEKYIIKYELRDAPSSLIYNTPILSGCFTLFKVDAIKEIGMYDDRYFMYFEDWDLSRRIAEKYKTVYFPDVSVIHGYESGANKSKRLFIIFVKSYFHYFNKWGWFFDKNRSKINQKTLSQFK